MGLSFLGSSVSDCKCSNCTCNEEILKKLPNPNPNNFEILQQFTLQQYTILTVRYPDCTNYEGQKILLYKDTPDGYFDDTKHLDPHFIDGGSNYLIARFIPTKEGVDLAMFLVKSLLISSVQI